MSLPTNTTLFFAPANRYARAEIVVLTAKMADERIHADWWSDECLLDHLDPPPIDRDWNWNDMEVEYDGKRLAVMDVAIVTGDRAVQGAMIVSTDPVPSALVPGGEAVFLELLFTAPRNRPTLRRDRKPFFVGVGTELLTWAAGLSMEMGHRGRLRLDGSPDYLEWYEKRGLQKLPMKPILFEGVPYTPMELSACGAERLLDG